MRRAAVAVAAALLLGGCGSSTEPAAADVRQALEARLLGRNLSFEWVYCLPSKLDHDGEPIFRCNVNFGEPHIVIYCVTLTGGTLLTNREIPAIRCGRGVS